MSGNGCYSKRLMMGGGWLIRIGRISHRWVTVCDGNVSGWIWLNGGGFITGLNSLIVSGIMCCCCLCA